MFPFFTFLCHVKLYINPKIVKMNNVSIMQSWRNKLLKFEWFFYSPQASSCYYCKPPHDNLLFVRICIFFRMCPRFGPLQRTRYLSHFFLKMLSDELNFCNLRFQMGPLMINFLALQQGKWTLNKPWIVGLE